MNISHGPHSHSAFRSQWALSHTVAPASQRSPSQPPQPWQSSAAHRSPLLPLLTSIPPQPQPEPDLYAGFLYSLIHSFSPNHRLFMQFLGVCTLVLGTPPPSVSDIDLPFSRHSWFSLGHSSPLRLTRVSFMSEAHSGQAGILAKRRNWLLFPDARWPRAGHSVPGAHLHWRS